MSVWPALAPSPSLSSSEGVLVCVSIDVDPRFLEELLEALARVEFPINPRIYHEPTTLVEFPAYSGRLDEVRQALAAHRFDPDSIRVTSMLDEIHGESAAGASQKP